MPSQLNQKTTLDQNQGRPQATANQDPPSLDRRYGKIGIAAVAAALPFWSEAKQPAFAQKSVRIEDRFIELAA